MTPAVIASSSSGAPGWSERLRSSKALIPALAVLALSTVALATALVVGRTGSDSAVPAVPLSAPVATGLAPMDAPPQGMVQAPSAAPASVTRPAERVRVSPQAASRPPVGGPDGAPVARAPAAAPACANCGTVESVVAVQHAAPTSGVGAVAGGLVGGLLGNQIGRGNGRAAMTVLGAVGGGYAGNAIEGNMKRNTTYQVKVRMQDGRLRTIEQAQAPAVGTPVAIEGHNLRVLAPQGAPANPGGV